MASNPYPTPPPAGPPPPATGGAGLAPPPVNTTGAAPRSTGGAGVGPRVPRGPTTTRVPTSRTPNVRMPKELDARQDAKAARTGNAGGGGGKGHGGAGHPYNWLAPQGPGQLHKQALTTITSAYAPAFQNLSQQEKRTQAIYDKQASDNKYYAQWLDAQMGQLQAHADASNQSVLQTLKAEGQQPNQMQAGAATQATVQAGANTSLLDATRANNSGIIAAAQTRQQGAEQTAMTNIANARTKLTTSESGDIIKEVARLTGVEISKAQSTRSYNAAIQKLNATTALGAAKIAQSNTNNLRTTGTSAANNAANNATKLTVAGLNNLTRTNIDNANNQTRSAIAAASNAVRSGRAANPKDIAAIQGRVASVSGLINQLANYGLHGQDAYHLVQNGGYVHVGDKTNSKGQKVPIMKYIPPVHYPDGTQILNAAYNVSNNGGNGLTAGDLAWLKSVGVDTSQYRHAGILSNNPVANIRF